MKYNIRMNRSELLAGAWFMIKKNVVKQKAVLESVLLLLLLAIFYTGMRPEAAHWFKFLLLPLAICLPWLIKIYVVYRNSRIYIENDVELRLENGMLCLTSYNEVLYPVCHITGNYTEKKLLLLEYSPARGIRTYFPIPRRIFHGKDEIAFLQELDRQKREMEEADDKGERAAPAEAGYEGERAAPAEAGYEGERAAPAEAGYKGERAAPAEAGYEGERAAQAEAGVKSVGRKKSYQFTGPTQPAELAHMLAAIGAAERLFKEPRKRIRVLPLLLASVLLGIVLFGNMGGLVCILSFIFIMLYRENGRTESGYRKSLEKEISSGKIPGLYKEIQLDSDKITCNIGPHICHYSYMKWNILLQVEDVYIFCHSRGVSYGAVARSFFTTQEEEQQFLRFCEQQGVRRMVCPKKIRKKSSEKLLLYSFIFVLFLAFVISGNREAAREVPYVAGEEPEEEYKFRPEDYPDYVPLQQQKVILEELGFTVPESLIQELKQNMQDYEYAIVYIEGYPYTQILSILGYPDHDKETWEVTAYSEQAYWLDWEGFNLFGDYENILEGVEAMSHGEVDFDNIQIHTDKVNWEKGTGTILIDLTCNGNVYDLKLSVQSDWLDTSVISKVNQILEAEKLTNRVRFCGDNGQGAILFYCDSAWASEFEKKTGIPLD